MEPIALALAALALLVAFFALLSAKAARMAADDASADARRHARNATEEIGAAIETTRRLLARVAAGGEVSSEMILEGRLWQDVDAKAAKTLVEEGDGAVVVDVRSPHETAGGVVEGALLIPIDDLEARKAEIPMSGRRVLVYCAGGGRSAAACEFLASEGYEGLHNLEAGFGSWTGSVARPG